MARSFPPLFFLRHGETEWNSQGRFQGHLDSPLTAQGRNQAAAQNVILRRFFPDGIPVVWASPAGRVQATAEIALEGLSLAEPRREDARLLEIMMGDWQGHTRDEIATKWPDLFRTAEDAGAHWQFYAPGGETLDQMVSRCASVLDELSGPTVILTHGITSRILRSIVLGRDPLAMMELPGGQGNVHKIEDGQAEELT